MKIKRIAKETFIESFLPPREKYETGPGTHFIPYNPPNIERQ